MTLNYEGILQLVLFINLIIIYIFQLTALGTTFSATSAPTFSVNSSGINIKNQTSLYAAISTAASVIIVSLG